MIIQIYRVSEKENSASFIHKEVCRDCARKFQKKGFSIAKTELDKAGVNLFTDNF